LIKLLPYILSDKIHLYFSIGNGQPSEPALCQLYRHTFVLYPVHVSLAIPERYLADLCVPAASTDGRRQSRSAVSGVLLVPSTRTSTGQRSFAAYLEPTTNGPPITRTVGLLVQAPARRPPVPALQVDHCWRMAPEPLTDRSRLFVHRN